ncbi:hypothetical protein TNCV_738161 [Trichonephila clavipes]|nr:hypothetical protein TNCV_738161 [Trichonephila clavipes]
MNWMAHVIGMSDDNVVKKVLQFKLTGILKCGRPRLRWADSVESVFGINIRLPKEVILPDLLTSVVHSKRHAGCSLTTGRATQARQVGGETPDLDSPGWAWG